MGSTLGDEYEEILIELYDKKKKATKSERHLLGQVVLSVNEFPTGKLEDLWLDIQPPPSFDPKHVITGILHIVAERARNSKV